MRVHAAVIVICLTALAGNTSSRAETVPYVPHQVQADEAAVRKGIDLFCETHLFSDNADTKRRCAEAELNSWSILMTLAGSTTADVLALPALCRCAHVSDEDAAQLAVDWRRVLSCWNN